MEIKNEGYFRKFIFKILNSNIKSDKILHRIEGGNLSKGFEDIYLGLPNNKHIFIELKVSDGFVHGDGDNEGTYYFKKCQFEPAQIDCLKKRFINGNTAFLCIYLPATQIICIFKSEHLKSDILITNRIWAKYFHYSKYFHNCLMNIESQKKLVEYIING